MKPKVGIVGGGPAGLYLAHQLAKETDVDIFLWEKEKYIGGRTRMGFVGKTKVVGGAGVVRNKDKRLKKIAKPLLQPFVSKYNIGFPHTQHRLSDWIKRLEKDFSKMDRTKDFETNLRNLYGEKGWNDFKQWVGYTDYKKADVNDTIKDYGFDDCLPNQKMFMVDWDTLAINLLPEVSFQCFLNSPVTRVKKTSDDNFIVTSKGQPDIIVNCLVWTAPRPSWEILDPLFSVKLLQKWNQIKKGVHSQPFLRLYGKPIDQDKEKAKQLFPKHTLLPYWNPLGKLIPYGKDLYMISYSDNENAKRVIGRKNDKKWLKKYTGIRWGKTKSFYFPCGTHYFSPLDTYTFKDRDDFFRVGQNPLSKLFLAGEALSHNQGWTEGALESVEKILPKIKKCMFR